MKAKGKSPAPPANLVEILLLNVKEKKTISRHKKKNKRGCIDTRHCTQEFSCCPRQVRSKWTIQNLLRLTVQKKAGRTGEKAKKVG